MADANVWVRNYTEKNQKKYSIVQVSLPAKRDQYKKEEELPRV